MNAFAHALDNGLFSVEKVCTDCLMAQENGDTSGNAADWDEARYSDTLTRYEVTIGHPHLGEWADDCWHSGELCADDCDCERTTFSTSECGMCGSSLHGERQDYIFIERSLVR